MIDGEVTRLVRAECWRAGEKIDETPVNADGTFERPLKCEKGDVIYPIVEIARKPIMLPCVSQINRFHT